MNHHFDPSYPWPIQAELDRVRDLQLPREIDNFAELQKPFPFGKPASLPNVKRHTYAKGIAIITLQMVAAVVVWKILNLFY